MNTPAQAQINILSTGFKLSKRRDGLSQQTFSRLLRNQTRTILQRVSVLPNNKNTSTPSKPTMSSTESLPLPKLQTLPNNGGSICTNMFLQTFSHDSMPKPLTRTTLKKQVIPSFYTIPTKQTLEITQNTLFQHFIISSWAILNSKP